MDTIISLNQKEVTFLTRLLAAEYQNKNERQLHAASHGSDFYDPDMAALCSLLDKLESK